jgi:ferredoxin
MQQDTYLRTEAATLLEKCTACGKCVEVCPNLPHLPEAGDPLGARSLKPHETGDRNRKS